MGCGSSVQQKAALHNTTSEISRGENSAAKPLGEKNNGQILSKPFHYRDRSRTVSGSSSSTLCLTKSTRPSPASDVLEFQAAWLDARTIQSHCSKVGPGGRDQAKTALASYLKDSVTYSRQSSLTLLCSHAAPILDKKPQLPVAKLTP